MLQDLKVGHILGGTPAKMQIGDIFGIIVASPMLFFVLMVLDKPTTSAALNWRRRRPG